MEISKLFSELKGNGTPESKLLKKNIIIDINNWDLYLEPVNRENAVHIFQTNAFSSSELLKWFQALISFSRLTEEFPWNLLREFSEVGNYALQTYLQVVEIAWHIHTCRRKKISNYIYRWVLEKICHIHTDGIKDIQNRWYWRDIETPYKMAFFKV